jgi:RNA polymerase sigma factor (sigma-70 family)
LHDTGRDELTKRKRSPESQQKNEIVEKLIKDFTADIFAKLRAFNYQKYGIDRDDLLQEIHIKLWKAYKNEKNIKNFRSYIKKIVRSVAVDRIQESRREIETQRRQGRESPETQIGHRQRSKAECDILKDAVLRSLKELKESRRKVLSLILLDFSLEEIGELLKSKRGKILSLYYRGLKDLKKRLKKGGIFYED